MQGTLFEFQFERDNAETDDADPRNCLSKAGEFLVAAELTLMRFDVTIAAEKLPYDLLADKDGKILKVQVKASSYSPDRQGYRFCTNRCSHKGSGKSRPYGPEDVDLFAFVAVDVRAIAFFPSNDINGGIIDLSRTAMLRADVSTYTMDRSLERLRAA